MWLSGNILHPTPTPVQVSCYEQGWELAEAPVPGPHLSSGCSSKLLSQVIKGPLPRTLLTSLGRRGVQTTGFLGLLGNHKC